jgi:hypothetical protein
VERAARGDYDQLHHFIAAGVWDAGPVETELLVQADKLVGGSDAVLRIPTLAGQRNHFACLSADYFSDLLALIRGRY